MTRLPDSVGDLIRLAIKDLEACESSPNYKIEMDVWHKPDPVDNKCWVCLAGSVMAQRFDTDPSLDVYPSDLHRSTKDKLLMLNLCRHLPCSISGSSHRARQGLFKNYTKVIEPWARLETTTYAKDPVQFKKGMLRLADLMDEYDVCYTGA